MNIGQFSTGIMRFSQIKRNLLFGIGGGLKLWMELREELKKQCVVKAKFSESVIVWGAKFSKGEGPIKIYTIKIDLHNVKSLRVVFQYTYGRFHCAFLGPFI